MERRSLAIKEIEGLAWPAADLECWPAMQNESRHIAPRWLPHVKGRRVAVQAGGNCGVYPAELAKHFEAVYTAEPDHENFCCLTRNAASGNVFAMRAAFGRDRGTVGMRWFPQNTGAHYLEGNGLVPVLRIDDLGLSACDLIALDVEGAELVALEGAVETVEKFKPTLIVEEKGHIRRFGQHPAELEKWIRARGYQERDRVFRDRIWCV